MNIADPLRTLRHLASLLLFASAALAQTEDKIAYNSATSAFSSTGPVSADAGDRISVAIIDSDSRRSWTVSLNYERPAGERLSGALRVASLFAGVPVPEPQKNPEVSTAKDPEEEIGTVVASLESQARLLSSKTKMFLEVSRPHTEARDELRKVSTEVRRGLLTLEQLLVESRYLKGPPVSTRQPQATSKARTFAIAAETVRLAAEKASRQANALESMLVENEKTRLARFTVRSGFERIVIQVCTQRLLLSGTTVARSGVECSQSRYVLSVNNPLGGVMAAAGITFPFYIKKPDVFSLENDMLAKHRVDKLAADVEPSVFLGARYILDNESLLHVGADLGFGVGGGLGRFFTFGPEFGVYGISVGGGVYLDMKGTRVERPETSSGDLVARTEAAPLAGPYFKVALSSDLWDLLSSGAEAPGPDNAPKSEMPGDSARSPTEANSDDVQQRPAVPRTGDTHSKPAGSQLPSEEGVLPLELPEHGEP